MTLKEFQHRLDELLEAAERDELPPAELFLMLDEAAEVQRGDVFRHEDPRIGRHERMPPP
jgi:hypothetical protein